MGWFGLSRPQEQPVAAHLFGDFIDEAVGIAQTCHSLPLPLSYTPTARLAKPRPCALRTNPLEAAAIVSKFDRI